MSNIVRTPTKVTGGITPDEKQRMDALAQEWIGVATRTDPIDPAKIVPAIEGLYAAAKLKKPRVVIVPSPLVMAFAYGASAWIWHCRKNGKDAALVAATDEATNVATDLATHVATYVATRVATDSATLAATSETTNHATGAATYAATDETTYAATDSATYAATDSATNSATNVATYVATNAATYEATDTATYAAADSATGAATGAATDAATFAATRAATNAATNAATSTATDVATSTATDVATLAATDGATRAAMGAATNVATDEATYDATYDATRAATDAATDSATYAATRAATNGATDEATKNEETSAALACRELAGAGGLQCAKEWHKSYQGGNMWAGWSAYLAAFRDVSGLRLKEHAAFAPFEAASREGGFRVMHEEFCMVSDFPEVLKKDEQNRPHCENGPSHRWRDGWSLYHWHGVRVPAEWIENKASLTAQMALSQTNTERRRAACEILGWAKILKELNAKTINKNKDPQIGELIQVDLPEAPGEKFLRVTCATSREFAIPVPKDMETAMQANAWTFGLDPKQFNPEVRT